MLDVPGIVVEQFTDIGNARAVIRVDQCQQWGWTRVLYLFLFPFVPDPGNGLHFHWPFYLQLCPLRQGGDILKFSLQLRLPRVHG